MILFRTSILEVEDQFDDDSVSTDIDQIPDQCFPMRKEMVGNNSSFSLLLLQFCLNLFIISI